MAKQIPEKEQTEATFSGAQWADSAEFAEQCDLATALLERGKQYTRREAQFEINGFLKRRVD